MKITSKITGRTYEPENKLWSANMRQLVFYLEKEIPIYDIMPSKGRIIY